MTDQAARLALVEACAAIAARHGMTMPSTVADLQARVHAMTDEMKAEGVPMERVMLAIKAIARGCGLEREAPELTGRAVQWSIVRFYADDPPSDKESLKFPRVGGHSSPSGEG